MLLKTKEKKIKEDEDEEVKVEEEDEVYARYDVLPLPIYGNYNSLGGTQSPLVSSRCEAVVGKYLSNVESLASAIAPMEQLEDQALPHLQNHTSLPWQMGFHSVFSHT